jgi:hypothetical protein
MDPRIRIRIHTKILWILWNTGKNKSKDLKSKSTFRAIAGLIAGPIVLPADTTAQQQVRRRRRR